MPLFERSLRHLLRRSGHVERARRGEVLLGPLVDDGAADAVVDAEGEVLAEGQDLDAVGLAVGDDLVAEHGAHGVVAHVVAHLGNRSKVLVEDKSKQNIGLQHGLDSIHDPAKTVSDETPETQGTRVHLTMLYIYFSYPG